MGGKGKKMLRREGEVGREDAKAMGRRWERRLNEMGRRWGRRGEEGKAMIKTSVMAALLCSMDTLLHERWGEEGVKMWRRWPNSPCREGNQEKATK
jgi:predicted DNA-binding WGR domain protein